MPIREFECERGHVTERIIMSAAKDKATKKVKCEKPRCVKWAQRREISGSTSLSPEFATVVRREEAKISHAGSGPRSGAADPMAI